MCKEKDQLLYVNNIIKEFNKSIKPAIFKMQNILNDLIENPIKVKNHRDDYVTVINSSILTINKFLDRNKKDRDLNEIEKFVLNNYLETCILLNGFMGRLLYIINRRDIQSYEYGPLLNILQNIIKKKLIHY